jgi:hypothetical protein
MPTNQRESSFQNSLGFSCQTKLHPKYYKHCNALEGSCSAQQFGQIKIGLFLADLFVHQVRPKNLTNIVKGHP